MPDSKSIRQSNATSIYSAVIDNYRRAYGEKYNTRAEDLTDTEILECWEVGWMEPTSETEDAAVIEEMRDRVLAKLAD